MTSYAFAEDNEYELIDTDQIDELLHLFDMHNLMPKLSKNEHVYATSLAMLIASLNWSGNARHLFESLPYTRGREIDLLDIVNTMANLGYESHHIDMNLSDIDDRLMPCLFIPDRDNAHPLILLNKEGKNITGFHSKDRKKIIFKAGELHGEAYFFKKINHEETEEDFQTKKAAGLKWFDMLLSKFRPIIREVVLTSVLINIFALAMPLFIMSIYDSVIGSGSTITLWNLLVGVLIAVTAEAFLRIVRLRSLVWLGVRLDNIVSNSIFERLLLMKASYTEGAPISAQISRIRTFESIRKFFTGPLFSVIVELPFTIILIVVIWFLTGPLVYIPIVVLSLFALILLYYQSYLRVSMRSAARASTHRQQFGMETFLKMYSLHYNGMAKSWWEKYKEKLSRSSMASFKTNMISSTIESAAHSISMLSGIAVIAFGVQLIWEGSITIGALVATMILIWRVLAPLQTMCSMLPRLEQLKSSIEQINRLMSIETERKHTVLKRPIEHMDGFVEMHNLGLRYSSEIEPLFVGLDLKVARGEVVAITGVNGSGKSSVLKLINGLYYPQTGTIRIDGINIKQQEPVELRNYITYLPQTPMIFEGTVKENILMTNPLASDEDIKNSLVKAKCYKDVMKLPEGLDTMISGQDANLPMNLRYSLNLVRAYLKNSNILLLDEMPNAILNSSTGEGYRDLIAISKGRKTVFFISQRDDFIKLADKVVVLRPGNRPIIMKSDEFLKKYS